MHMKTSALVVFKISSICLLVMAFGAAKTNAIANVILYDGTFYLSNYTETSGSSSNASLTAVQCPNCGNPGTALQVTVAATPPGGVAHVGFLNNGFAYDPSTQGAIASIAASLDMNLTFSRTFGSPGFSSGFAPLIEQDGKYYRAHISGILFPGGTPAGPTGYQTISMSRLVAADFTGYDPSTGSALPGEPDFSGDPMLFGLLVGATLGIFGGPPFTQAFTVVADDDNLAFDISPVPEPSSLLLLASAFAGIGIVRRKKLSTSRCAS
jgi:hypothetical protein